MHRFFVDTPLAGTEGQEVALPAAVARQVGRVLRLRPGATIELLDGEGSAFLVELMSLAADRAVGRVGMGRPVETEPRLAVTLYAAPLKGDHWGYTLQKGTEIGAAAFVPILTERTVAGGEASGSKLERWRRIAREAAEQTGRGRVPRVAEPLPFAEACARAAVAGPALIPWEEEGERGRGLRTAIEELRAAGALTSLGLFIGPEGGFSAAEIATARAQGIASVTLGPRILRADTAAAVALALALSTAGDLD